MSVFKNTYGENMYKIVNVWEVSAIRKLLVYFHKLQGSLNSSSVCLQIGVASLDNARIILQIDNSKLAAEDFRVKLVQ